MVGGINVTLANVIVAIVILCMIGATPLAVWLWNRRTGKFSAMLRDGVPGWAPPLTPPPAPMDTGPITAPMANPKPPAAQAKPAPQAKAKQSSKKT